MKVLLTSDFTLPVRGGLENHVDTLATELANRGHQVCIATLTSNPVARHRDVGLRTVKSAARYLPHENADRPFHPPLPEPVARAQLSRIVNEFEPDVIHAHSWLGVSLPKQASAPVILTAHDYGFICELRTLLRSDASICSGPALGKCIACARSTYGVPIATALALGTSSGRRLLRANRIVAVSTAVAIALQPYFSRTIDIIPNFVGAEPAESLLPAELPAGGFVLFGGDPGAHKGVGDLLSLWSSPQTPQLPLVLALTRALNTEVPANVFVTSLSGSQMASAWRAAAIAVVPSRWPDPCPTVVLEAMRAGTPVVGTDVGGLPDLMRNGVEGFLVQPGDIETMRARIVDLATDVALRERMGAAARTRAESFAASVVVDRIIGVYSEAILGS